MYGEDFDHSLVPLKDIAPRTNVHCSIKRVEDVIQGDNKPSQLSDIAVPDQQQQITADWSLPPSAVEWLGSGQEQQNNCYSNQIEPSRDSNTLLFQRISMEIDAMKGAIYDIVMKGSGLPEPSLQWQEGDQSSPEQEQCALVPNSQNTSSGYEEDLRGSQSICSEM